jgi:hypothetical protein
MRLERRSWPRISLLDRSETTCGARLLPGWPATVIDLSIGGALLETECRLTPGAPVELQLTGIGSGQRVRARVTRSQVAAIHRHDGIRYRAALIFDDQADCGVGSAHCG